MQFQWVFFYLPCFESFSESLEKLKLFASICPGITVDEGNAGDKRHAMLANEGLGLPARGKATPRGQRDSVQRDAAPREQPRVRGTQPEGPGQTDPLLSFAQITLINLWLGQGVFISHG